MIKAFQYENNAEGSWLRMVDEQSNNKPLFVVGMSRSGTSYIHDLVNLHPLIKLSYEGRILTEGHALYKQVQPLQDQQAFDGFLERLVGLDRDERQNHWIAEAITPTARQALFSEYHEHSSFQSIVESLYQLTGPVEYWGNKMLRIEMIPQIIALWPQSKFLVLLRDPRAVYASQKSFFSFRRLKSLAIYYNLHSKWVEQHCKDPAKYHIVKYEEFVTNPVEQLGDILKFLDLWDARSVTTILEKKPASTGSLYKWANELSIDEITQIESYCFQSMLVNGYEAKYAKEQISISGLSKLTELVLENFHRVPLNPAEWYRKNLLQRLWVSIRASA